MNRKRKVAKIRAKRDMSTMDQLRSKEVNPLDWNKKFRCSGCGRSMPDNHYHGKCQECYFRDNDVTLKP